MEAAVCGVSASRAGCPPGGHIKRTDSQCDHGLLPAALSIEVIAEGVETEAELAFLREQNVHLFQGYLLARPAFEQVPDINWSAVAHG